jgi:glycosyltransferase involved in cell wall biosynthesis
VSVLSLGTFFAAHPTPTDSELAGDDVHMAKSRRDVRVLIAAEHASSRFGGESILPLHIFRGLRRRGIEAWLVVHGRTRRELEAEFPTELDRIHFIPEAPIHRLLFRLGEWLPDRINYLSTGLISRLLTQRSARRIVKRLVVEHGIDVVHQPIPVSPREPSLMYGVGAPVLMGPMNGGMSYPEAFRGRQSHFVTGFLQMAHWVADLAHQLVPGKIRAEMLLVANERTREALPHSVRGEVRTMIENGVDLSIWRPAGRDRAKEGPARFVFVGRLIDCKAVDLLLEAFRDVLVHTPATLVVAGDGPLRRRWEARANELGLGGAVQFLGWIVQKDCASLLRRSDVLVLPSLHECGGAVVLEAMAAALPVIAANWGGPADYVDQSCGILVDPTSRIAFVEGLARAMTLLATNPDLRRELGQAGRERVARDFQWEKKITDLLEIYERMIRSRPPRHPASRPDFLAPRPVIF